jgi:hypothetical protein
MGRKYMKKIICLVLIAAMIVFAATGCSSAITDAVKGAVASSVKSADQAAGSTSEAAESPAANMTAATGLKLNDSYNNYITAKSNLVGNISNAIGEDENAGGLALAPMELLGVSFTDLMLLPLTVIGASDDPKVAGAALGMLGMEGIKYTANGDAFKVEYNDSDKKANVIDAKYDAGSGSLTSTMTEDGAFVVLSEYTTTKTGYAGQIYYKNDDGTFETVKLVMDANGANGIVGISHNQKDKPATVFGKGDGVGATFGKNCEDWFVLNGGKLSASVQGQSYNQ